MDHQRKEERRKVMTFTPVYDIQKKLLLGYLSDLTLNGAMLVSEKPMDVDRNIILGIEIHESSDAPVTRMVIPSRAIWCKREDDNSYYDTGFEFREMSDENKQLIESALKKFQFSRGIPD